MTHTSLAEQPCAQTGITVHEIDQDRPFTCDEIDKKDIIYDLTKLYVIALTSFLTILFLIERNQKEG